MTTTADLAIALGKARAAYERSDDDARLYVRMLEAQIALQKAEITDRDKTVLRERSRSREIGRRLKALRVSRQQSANAAAAKAKRAERAKRHRRADRNTRAAVPLLAHADVDDFVGLALDPSEQAGAGE